MCLAIPGKVVGIEVRRGLAYRPSAIRGHSSRDEPRLCSRGDGGDYVLVHVGFAISLVDAAEAKRTYRLWEQLRAIEDELYSAHKSADFCVASVFAPSPCQTICGIEEKLSWRSEKQIHQADRFGRQISDMT